MAGGRQKRTESTPSVALRSTPRWAHRTLWVACGVWLLATSTPALAQVRSNKNVPTWAWADEIVQPNSNIIAPKSKPKSPSREIIRQLLTQARKSAHLGQIDVAEKLAQRADVLLKRTLAADPEGWDAAEQPPASFLRQLAEFRARQTPMPAAKEPAPQTSKQALADAKGVAPAPPQLELHDSEFADDPLDADLAGPFRRSKRKGNSLRNGLDWSADAELDANLADEILAKSARSARLHHGLAESSDDEWNAEDMDAVDSGDEFSDEALPPVAGTERRSRTGERHASASAPPPPVTERIIQIQEAPEKSSSSMLAAAMVHLLSTAAGIVLGILVLVGVRTFLKRRYNADFGFVFRVEHVATGEDGAYLPYTYFPGMQPSEPLPMPTAGPGRDGVAAVLTELPAGFQSDELSLYEEQRRKEEEAESEMMKMLLQQNLELREELGGRKNIAA